MLLRCRWRRRSLRPNPTTEHHRSFHSPFIIVVALCIHLYIPSIDVYTTFFAPPEQFLRILAFMRRNSPNLRSDILCDETSQKWGPSDTYAPNSPKTLTTNLVDFGEKISDLSQHIGGSWWASCFGDRTNACRPVRRHYGNFRKGPLR